MERRVVYRKYVKLREVGDGGFEFSIPKIIVERAARKAGQSLDEFRKTHRVVHLFNDFSDFDAAYKFVPAEDTEEIEIPSIE